MGDTAIIEKAGKPQELPTCFRCSPSSTLRHGAPSTPSVLGAMDPDGQMGVAALL